MNNVATIEKIININIHPNADRLVICNIKGYQICSQKDQFKLGDMVVYVVIDSITDELPQYEFLRAKHFKIKPIKLRGELSMGLILPISILKEFGHTDIELYEGMEVSHLIGIKHYEKPEPAQLGGTVKGNRPSYIRKTDEERLQSNLKYIDALLGKPYYISQKIDGSSFTAYIKDGSFGVCSRNLELTFDENNSFWKMAIKYDVENKLKSYFGDKNICIQGELCGSGVNGNKLGLSTIDLVLFNLFDIDTQKYLPIDQLEKFCKESNIPMVPIIERGNSFNYTLEQLQSMSNDLKYPNGSVAEGIVIRSSEELMCGRYNNERLSFKVINEKFLMKYES